jgi:hypothetical protein
MDLPFRDFLSLLTRFKLNRRRRATAVAAAALCAAAGLVLAGTPASADPPSVTGSPGPCTVQQVSIPDPTGSGFRVTIASPMGTAATPLMGGTCGDAQRPVVVVIHGFLATQPFFYQGLITHEASNGNVVIYAPWHTILPNFANVYAQEVASVKAAVATLPRADTTRVGMIGHSLGGGMMPYLGQALAALGWGQQGYWVGVLTPDAAQAVGTGSLPLPANTRVMVIAVDHDTAVDNRFGIDQFNGFNVPAAQKQYVLVRSDPRMVATHVIPNGLPLPENPLRQYGIFRNLDATETCAVLGNCDTDLTYMGVWPDGTAVTPALVEAQPVDTGPRGAIECPYLGNPRRTLCPPSIVTATTKPQ